MLPKDSSSRSAVWYRELRQPRRSALLLSEGSRVCRTLDLYIGPHAAGLHYRKLIKHSRLVNKDCRDGIVLSLPFYRSHKGRFAGKKKNPQGYRLPANLCLSRLYYGLVLYFHSAFVFSEFTRE